MKQLSDYLKILPLTDYDSFDGSSLISKSHVAPDHIVSNNNLVFNTKPENSPAGDYFTETLRVITDKLTDSQREKYTSRRPVVVLLFTDIAEPVLWGDADEKVRATVTPSIDYDIIDLTRKTTKALF